MTAIAITLILLIGGLVGYMIWRTSEPDRPTEIDPEQAMKAAVELHRIRRNLDVAWMRSEQRRETAALRREIGEVMKEPEGQ
jgi:hypothetical protein